MLPKPPSLKRPRLVEDILCHPLRERLPALLHTTQKSHAVASQSNSLANMGVKHSASRHRENLTSKAIEYRSEPLSISPSRAPPEYKQRRGVTRYAEVEESRSLVRYDSRRGHAESEAGGELCVMEVEEDLPRKRKSIREGWRCCENLE